MLNVDAGRAFAIAENCDMNPGNAFAAVDETLAVGPPATNGECMQRPPFTVPSQLRANCQPLFEGFPIARSANPGATVGFET